MMERMKALKKLKRIEELVGVMSGYLHVRGIRDFPPTDPDNREVLRYFELLIYVQKELWQLWLNFPIGVK